MLEIRINVVREGKLSEAGPSASERRQVFIADRACTVPYAYCVQLVFICVTKWVACEVNFELFERQEMEQRGSELAEAGA